ncbi:MAG: tetratricopeptide repeat protein [Bacteroidota bacterium]
MHKRITLYLSTILLVFNMASLVQAQPGKEVDSLKQVLDTIQNSTSQASINYRLNELLMFTNPEGALTYAKNGLRISEALDNTRLIGSGYMQIGNYHYNSSNNDSASYYYQIALTKFKEADNLKGQLFVMHTLVDIMREIGDYDSAIALININLSIYEDSVSSKAELGSFNLIGAEYHVLSSIYTDMGKYRLALNEALKSVRFFNNTGDRIREADGLKSVADIEYSLENYSSSYDYANKAFKIYEEYEDKVYQSFAVNTMGLASSELQNYDDAIEYFLKATQLAREMDIEAVLTSALSNLGNVYTKLKEYDKARDRLNEALIVARSTGVKLNTASVLLELGRLDYKTKNLKSALSNVNGTIDLVAEINASSYLSPAYELRSKIYEDQGNQEKALEDYQQFHALNDSIFNVKKSQQIEELLTIYETEKKEVALALKEKEVENLNQEVEINTLQKELYAVGMFTFISVSGLLFFSFRQRMKRNKIEREQQEELLKKEIEHKKKELTSQTLHLVQKNTFIQELSDNLNNAKDSPEKLNTMLNRMGMLIKRENSSDRDWETFKNYFVEVHNDFDEKLKAVNGDISEKEIRLAAFIKMKLTTKEIAATLSVLPDSVLKSKYRLKKKFGLSKQEDLYEYLNTL